MKTNRLDAVVAYPRNRTNPQSAKSRVSASKNAATGLPIPVHVVVRCTVHIAVRVDVSAHRRTVNVESRFGRVEVVPTGAGAPVDALPQQEQHKHRDSDHQQSCDQFVICEVHSVTGLLGLSSLHCTCNQHRQQGDRCSAAFEPLVDWQWFRLPIVATHDATTRWSALSSRVCIARPPLHVKELHP